MKQKRLINYLKIGILLFGISFILQNCEKDDFQQNIENSDKTQEIISRKFSLEKIPHFNQVKEKLNKINSNLNDASQLRNRTVNTDNDSISILTNDILYMEYAQTHTYTFKINRTNPQHFIENIVLHYNVDSQSYDEYLIQYNISFEQYQNVLNDIPLDENVEVDMFQLDNGTLVSLLSRSSCIRTCRTIMVRCTAGGNHAPNDPECCANKGTCGSDQGGFYFQSCGLFCIDPGTVTEDPDPFPGADGGGGGAGNGTVATNPNPIPCRGDDYEIDVNGNCFEEDGGNSLEPNPCSYIDGLLANDNIKDLIEGLNTDANLSLNYEKGFQFTTADDGSLSSTAIDGNPNDNSIQVLLNDQGTITGFVHTHYDGLVPNFSIEDIRTFNGMYQWRKYNQKSLRDLTIMVISRGGVYALVIDDENKFATEGYKLHEPEFVNIKTEYEDVFDSQTDAEKVERLMISDINTLSKYGLSLMKANDDLSGWQKVKPHPTNSNKTTYEDCN